MAELHSHLLQRLRYPTYDRRRAEAMGFFFDEPEVLKEPWARGPAVRIRIPFTCVCGTQEFFETVFDPTYERLEHLDVYRHLRQLGSFSRDHLLADGYSREQVAEFERRADAFDVQEGRRPEYRPEWRTL